MDFPVTEQFAKIANAAQLHSEAKGPKKDWPASFVELEPGKWVYRVDRDDVDAEAIKKVLASHVPDPNFGKSAAQIRKAELATKKNLTPAEVAEAVQLLLQG